MYEKNNIKSADLCERCVWGKDEGCLERECSQCPMGSEQRECKCDEVKIGTPCSYFKEAEG